MTPNDKDDVMAKMDAAAAKAATEIPIAGTAQQLADWLAKWYMSAGYKRLCQIVLKAFGYR